MRGLFAVDGWLLVRVRLDFGRAVSREARADPAWKVRGRRRRDFRTREVGHAVDGRKHGSRMAVVGRAGSLAFRPPPRGATA